MSDKTCPACSSSNLKRGTVKNRFTDNFGGSIEFDIIEYTCEDCESTGDFFKENDELLAKKAQELNEKAVLTILEYFANNHVSFASIERVLGLSQRTLTKWRNEVSAPTSAGIALMKFLKTFPWLLDVADAKFEYSAAQKIHMEAFMKTLISQIGVIKNETMTVNLSTTPNRISSALASATVMYNYPTYDLTKRHDGLLTTSNPMGSAWSIQEKQADFYPPLLAKETK